MRFELFTGSSTHKTLVEWFWALVFIWLMQYLTVPNFGRILTIQHSPQSVLGLTNFKILSITYSLAIDIHVHLQNRKNILKLNTLGIK